MNGDFFIRSVLTYMKGDICFFCAEPLFYIVGFDRDLSLWVPTEESYLSELYAELSACDATTTYLSEGTSIFKKHYGCFNAEFYFGYTLSGYDGDPVDTWGDGAIALL